MGQAKQRGTYEQRKAQAIAAGRVKGSRPSRIKVGAQGVQAMLPPALLRLFSAFRG